METLTEITQQEDARRQRAYFYERALADRASATNAVAGRQQEIERYANQIKLIAKLRKDAQALAEIDVSFNTLGSSMQGMVRDIVGHSLALAQRDQQRRLDDAREALTREEARLEAAERALTAFNE